MTRLGVRVVLVLAGLLVTAAAGYRAWEDELALGAARLTAADLDRSADTALRSIGDLRASMHAYVAPGQGIEFWSTRAAALLDTLRQQVLDVDAGAASRGVSLAETLDGLDRLAAAEQRAHRYVASGQVLLAGDVIFIEVRDLLEAAASEIAGARLSGRQAAEVLQAALRREQAGLAAAAVGAWVVVALVLLPRAGAVERPASSADATRGQPEPARDGLAGPDLDLPLDVGAVTADRGAASTQPEQRAAVAARVPSMVAEICSDLASLTDIGALSGALERAADVLGATGIIVWVAANDGSHLRAVAQHGFDPRLLARVGTLPRDAANLTASAFRTGSTQTSAATATSPAALAVALSGPSGPVGVLSAELRADADPAIVAWAGIFAAQLATLAQPVPEPSAGSPGAPLQAQA